MKIDCLKNSRIPIPIPIPIPNDPNSFNWKTLVLSSGHHYRFIDQNEDAEDVVLCFHGFPDLAFGWRYQIVELVRRTYRVIVPDLLGYGGTSKPIEIEPYRFSRICSSVCEILDHLKVKKVILLGHDWGAPLSGRFLFYFPDRIRAWVTICAPPKAGPKPGQAFIDFKTVIRKSIPHFGYQLYFMNERSGIELTRWTKSFLLLVYCHLARQLISSNARQLTASASGGQPSYVLEGVLRERLMESKDLLEDVEVKDPETEYYINEFRRGGMMGPVNWYKTRELNHSDDLTYKIPSTFPKNIPSLFIQATADEALPPSMISRSQLNELFPGGNLKVIQIKGANHWLLQDPEYRDEFTNELCDWIDEEMKKFKFKL
ncbi:soluble epoxide hydrolase [Melampsora americana]|nr:soluble epoxide hydrolase [Melampsora americana]